MNTCEMIPTASSALGVCVCVCARARARQRVASSLVSVSQVVGYINIGNLLAATPILAVLMFYRFGGQSRCDL